MPANPGLSMITVDTTDTRRLAAWWADRLGGEIAYEYGHWFSMVSVPGWTVSFGFQHVDDPTPGKNRIHVDLSWPAGTDRDGGVAEWVDAGATHLGQRGESGMRWDTFADPDGNEFCIAPPSGQA